MKTALITGAYGAIGKAIARQLSNKGFLTVLIGRDELRLKKATEEVKKETRNENVFHEVVDLSRKESIKSFALRWNQPADILINNAASSPEKRLETPEGIELQFATNVLGYFWMTIFFKEFMIGLEDARIVNVASYWAGGLDLDDLEFKKRIYDNDASYRQSKQANRMLTVAFAEKLKLYGITVNACHPGDVNSKLSNELGFGGHETPDQGAFTPVWVATEPTLKNTTGKYFENMLVVRCPFGQNMTSINRLYEICGKY